jgi:hypothetical protein
LILLCKKAAENLQDSKIRCTFAALLKKKALRRWAAPQQKTSFLHSVCTILAPTIGI